MARQSDRQLIASLTQEWQPQIRDAFLQAVQDVTDNVTLHVVATRLEAGDVNGAIEALGLDPLAFSPLDQALAQAYYAAGQAQVGNWPLVRDETGARVVFRFGVRNNAAEDWLRQYSSTLVTRIVDDQRAAIRTAMTEGLAQGRNPRVTALDIVGRVNRQTGQREGGIVGLTAQQERFVASARAELLSGDPALLANYLTRTRRDRRFDATVIAAMRDGKPMDADTVSKITGRYAARLLALRGEMIGQNETATAIGRARHDAIEQQIAAGKLDARDVTKVWRHLPGEEHPRLRHIEMDGVSVPYGEPFILPNGIAMAYPHDPEAPPSETIFCKCIYQLRIDFAGRLARQRRAA